MKSRLLVALLLVALSPLGCKSTAAKPERKVAQASTAMALDEDSDAAVFSPNLAQRSNIAEGVIRESALSAIVGPYSNADTPPVARFLQLAHQSIDIEIYEIDDPIVRAAIRGALARNVRVRIIKEPRPVGRSCDAFGTNDNVDARCRDLRQLVGEVRRAGGTFAPFEKDALCGQLQRDGRCYQHGKMILIDDRLALVSTGNFNSSSLCNASAEPRACNRDYTYITRDRRVVGAFREIFNRDLQAQRYQPMEILEKHAAQNLATVSPFSLEPLVQFLRSAQTRIQIQNQYLRQDSGLVDVLLEQAKKGVKIEIQLSDVCHFGRVSDSQAFELTKLFAALESAGAKIKMFTRTHRIQNHPGYLHAKAIVVDQSRAWIGSVNGSSTSLSQNREFGVFFSHPSRVRAVSEFMKQDFDHPTNQAWRDSIRCRNRPAANEADPDQESE